MTALATPEAAITAGKTQPRTAREKWRLRGPLLPALIFTIIVTQIPFLVTIAVSTLNWNILQPSDKSFLGLGNYQAFAGLQNYSTVFTDSRLRTAVLNTVVLTASVVVVSLLIGLALAILLDKRFPGRGLARTLLIAPFLVMPVAGALLWKHALYNPDYGLFNGVLTWIWQLFGAAEGPTVDYVSSTPMPAVIAALVWQWTPFMMLLVLAGLQAQPKDVLEAASVDGAGTWLTFRLITLPHLRRYIELGVLLGIIYVVNTFDQIYLMTAGGPGTASANLPFYIYQRAFLGFDVGQAAAMGVVVVIATIIVASAALRLIFRSFEVKE